MPNWQNPDDYNFTKRLNREQWAWEFLRRNPDYRKDWAWFWSTWQALEAEYGSPPHRDFMRWKNDPRAYVLDNGDEVCHGSDSCKVDGDKILIECWLGAKWGFYKFPLDPATDVPQIGEQLSWREVPLEALVIGVDDSKYLGQSIERLALGFDLALPLKEQLEVARRQLIATQHRLSKEGRLRMKRIAGMRERLTLCLRYLDAREAGAGDEAIASQLSLGEPAGEELAQLAMEATDWMVDGYRDLPGLPE